MERNFSREFQETDTQTIIEKVKIGVMETGLGAGTTFVATSLAKELAYSTKKAVAFVELCENSRGNGLLFDAMAMDKRFEGRKFHNFHRLVSENKYIRKCKNIDGRINWAVVPPNSMNVTLSALQELRLINNIRGDIIICDFGADIKEYLMGDMDMVICVMDPMPSQLISSRKIYRLLKQDENNGGAVVWIVNKMNDGINNKSFRDYMRIKDYISIPLIKPELFYTAEYNCRVFYEQKEIREKVQGKIKEIIEKHMVDPN